MQLHAWGLHCNTRAGSRRPHRVRWRQVLGAGYAGHPTSQHGPQLVAVQVPGDGVARAAAQARRPCLPPSPAGLHSAVTAENFHTAHENVVLLMWLAVLRMTRSDLPSTFVTYGEHRHFQLIQTGLIKCVGYPCYGRIEGRPVTCLLPQHLGTGCNEVVV